MQTTKTDARHGGWGSSIHLKKMSTGDSGVDASQPSAVETPCLGLFVP